MSNAYQSLAHCRWNYKYHVVFVPKRRRHTWLVAFAKRWVRFFMSWPGKKSVASSKGI